MLTSFPVHFSVVTKRKQENKMEKYCVVCLTIEYQHLQLKQAIFSALVQLSQTHNHFMRSIVCLCTIDFFSRFTIQLNRTPPRDWTRVVIWSNVIIRPTSTIHSQRLKPLGLLSTTTAQHQFKACSIFKHKCQGLRHVRHKLWWIFLISFRQTQKIIWKRFYIGSGWLEATDNVRT